MAQTDISTARLILELTEQAIVLQQNGWHREASQVLSKAKRIDKRSNNPDAQLSGNS